MNTTFGEIIKNARERQNMTLKHVADKVGLDLSMLAKIEKNQRYPSELFITKLSSFLDIDEEYLKMNMISDKVAYKLLEEDNSDEILKLAERKVSYFRSKQ